MTLPQVRSRTRSVSTVKTSSKPDRVCVVYDVTYVTDLFFFPAQVAGKTRHSAAPLSNRHHPDYRRFAVWKVPLIFYGKAFRYMEERTSKPCFFCPSFLLLVPGITRLEKDWPGKTRKKKDLLTVLFFLSLGLLTSSTP